MTQERETERSAFSELYDQYSIWCRLCSWRLQRVGSRASEVRRRLLPNNHLRDKSISSLLAWEKEAKKLRNNEPLLRGQVQDVFIAKFSAWRKRLDAIGVVYISGIFSCRMRVALTVCYVFRIYIILSRSTCVVAALRLHLAILKLDSIVRHLAFSHTEWALLHWATI